MLNLWSNSVVLALEASTAAGSVALWVHGVLVGGRDVVMGVGREDRLFPAIQSLLAEAALDPSAIGAIVCGEGPGSFTSLRIAGALAKGLAHGVPCPLYAAPSLLIAAASVPAGAPTFGAGARGVVHADALRGECYVLPVERGGDGVVRAVGPLARLQGSALRQQFLPEERVALGASLACPDDVSVSPHVSMLPNATGEWQYQPVDLAAWEPTYGRLAEAQVKWEAMHGTPLPSR